MTPTVADLRTRLAAGPLVLDGGLSTALEEDGADLTDVLWTARVLLDAPQRVREVHERSFRAGADVATTATYQASVPSLVAAGLSAAEAAELLDRGVRVARAAAETVAADTGRSLLVAASVGPYGAVLADGSEYRGRYGLTAAQLREFHGPRLELLAAAGADLLAVETIPDADEAAVLVELLDELGLPAWLSYSVAGARTRAGQPLEEAFAVAAGRRSLVAVGVNCSAPGDVLGAVTTAAAVTGLAGVAYPNRGEGWDAGSRRWTGAGAFNPALAPAWVDAGARLVGGCCRVGSDDVRRLAQQLAAAP